MSGSGGRLIVLLALLSLTLSCLTEGQVRLMGLRRELRLVRIYGVMEDQHLHPYVEQLGERLQRARGEEPGSVEFRILKHPSTNAYAIPNGTVFITGRMLVTLGSEEELAMVLAHELGHLEANHTRDNWNQLLRLRYLGLLALPVTIMMGEPEFMSGVLAGALLPSYTRENEREADDLAAEYLRLAGFDLACGLELFRKFESLRTLEGGERGWGFLSTHPEPGDRLDRLADEDEDPSTRECDTSYLDRVAGLRLTPVAGPAYEEVDGSFVLPRLLLRVRPRDEWRLGYTQYGFVLRDPFVVVEVTTYHGDETIEWARDQAQNWSEGPKEAKTILLDTSDHAGRPSVRLARRLHIQVINEVNLYHWTELGGRLYRFSAEVEKRDWGRVEPVMLDLVSRIDAIKPSDLDVLKLVSRISILTLDADATLRSLAGENPDWSAEQLGRLNATSPDRRLRAGQRIKVIERSPLPADERPPWGPPEPDLWERWRQRTGID